ncbi:Inosine/xanthosine triphosphatase [Anaerolineae bacterium]|nr:Inosine/xanthosine triphosphatase [Anaerolineae bacterium]
MANDKTAIRNSSIAISKMKIAIGSTNPVKIRAVRNVLRKIFPRAKFVALDVASGVPGQPRGDKQTRRGAVNRARAVREQARADFGVGLEAGIVVNEFGTMTCAWCAIVDRAGRVGIGGSTNMLLPDKVAARVQAGAELGDAMDAFANIKNVKRKMGAIGVLTKGLSDRQRAYESIIKLAMARFLWKDKYGNPASKIRNQ